MKRNLHAGRPGSGGLMLNVLTAAEMDEIHLGALEILMIKPRPRKPAEKHASR